MFARYVGKEVFITQGVQVGSVTDPQSGHRRHLMRTFDMVEERSRNRLDSTSSSAFLVTLPRPGGLGRDLANGGVNPVTGVRAIQSQYVEVPDET